MGMKLERLISIIYKLLNHEVISASALAEEFHVSPRTIYRDIDVICAAGFPVISHQGSSGGFGMMEGYKMDRSLLGSFDVDTLITVLASLSSVFEDERVQGTIERLQTIGTEQQAAPSLAVDLEGRRTDSDSLQKLRTAIQGRRVVTFDYVNANNERTTRDVEPMRLHYKYSNWYLYGYCRDKRDYREFRLTRMLNPMLTPAVYAPHTELPQAAGSTTRQGQERVEEVVLRVTPEAVALVLDQFHQVDKQFHEGGSMTLRIPVFRPLEARWLWSILLGFGSGAEVIEPPELRTILKEQLQKALKLYEEV